MSFQMAWSSFAARAHRREKAGPGADDNVRDRLVLRVIFVAVAAVLLAIVSAPFMVTRYVTAH